MRSFDLLVIGAGPGGYAAAIRASQLGMRTAVVEKEKAGGVCTNRGCIPTKAILSSAELLEEARRGEAYGLRLGTPAVDFPAVVRRSRETAERLSKGIEFLFRKNGVELLRGEAKLASPVTVRVGDEEVRAGRILVATGTAPKVLPPFPFDGERILSSDHALVLPSLPPSMAILGGGAVGVEFAYAFHAFGAEVTVVEMMPQLLPKADGEVARELASALGKKGIRILLSATAKGYDAVSGALRVETGGGEETVRAATLLVATGRTPLSAGLGLEEAGVVLDRGFVKVDGRYRTSCPSVFAVGDVIGGMMLAHEAVAEGVAAVEMMAGKDTPAVERRKVPSVVYCRPEVASVGLTEEEARALGGEVKVGKFPFLANGRALGSGHPEGFAKVVTAGPYGEIVGIHAIGHGVSELIASGSLALSLEATWRELGAALHPHPTFSEAIREAALAVGGEAIDI
jgi:dihydrolipoamide dehydrogenase